MNVLGLALYGPKAASTRYRLTQYVPGLQASGIKLDVFPLLGDEYIRKTFSGERYPYPRLLGDYLKRFSLLLQQSRYDAAIVNAELFPMLPGFLESKLLRIPYIYDFDDAFFMKYKAERFRRYSPILADKFDPFVKNASAIFAGNAYLAEYAKAINSNTIRLPTVVDTVRYHVVPNKSEGVFTIGWIGSPSTAIYINQLISALQIFARECMVRFIVIGGNCPAIDGVEVVNLPWDEEKEVDQINSFDVGVMPLFDDPWTKGKCAFKLIQYMACGVPVIGSRVGANIEVVSDACGLFADTTNEWLEAFRKLHRNVDMRQRSGWEGRRMVESKYSLESTLPIMRDTLASISKRGSK